MKNIVFYLSVLMSTTFLQAKGQQKIAGNDSVIYTKLMSMNFGVYKNKSGKVFFNDFGHRYSSAIPIMKKSGFIHSVLFCFSDSLCLQVRVKNYDQKERLNFNHEFRPDVFLLKKIEWVCVKYAGECIKGCEKLDCD